jgi:hypothetical protein
VNESEGVRSLRPGREHGVCVLNIAAAASSIGEALLSISRTVNSGCSLL